MWSTRRVTGEHRLSTLTLKVLAQSSSDRTLKKSCCGLDIARLLQKAPEQEASTVLQGSAGGLAENAASRLKGSPPLGLPRASSSSSSSSSSSHPWGCEGWMELRFLRFPEAMASGKLLPFLCVKGGCIAARAPGGVCYTVTSVPLTGQSLGGLKRTEEGSLGGVLLSQFLQLHSQQMWVTDMVCLPNLNLIAVSSTELKIEFFDISDHKCVRTFTFIDLDCCVLAMNYWSDYHRGVFCYGDTKGNVIVFISDSVTTGLFNPHILPRLSKWGSPDAQEWGRGWEWVEVGPELALALGCSSHSMLWTSGEVAKAPVGTGLSGLWEREWWGSNSRRPGAEKRSILLQADLVQSPPTVPRELMKERWWAGATRCAAVEWCLRTPALPLEQRPTLGLPSTLVSAFKVELVSSSEMHGLTPPSPAASFLRIPWQLPSDPRPECQAFPTYFLKLPLRVACVCPLAHPSVSSSLSLEVH
ncbi:Hypothetical predicted protein [Marmota monax]|uniref:Uncharacterized protein n=1 Tax=Marmota monax TaxID=9995 RepID=A0A5E4A6X1_MARMO|nr:hypothetical protein GHT09_016449 [Marmota monax]VTJ52735.1 Hypothetical predicted protein [Marmota monax]